ncbi:AP-3 complex subunit mu-1, partial [Cladochytrium tenue]
MVPSLIATHITMLRTTLSKVIIQKQCRSSLGDPQPALEYFMAELVRLRATAGGAAETLTAPAGDGDPDRDGISDVVPLMSTPEHYIIFVARGGLHFVAIVTREVSPLTIVEFLHKMVDLFEDYFGPMSEQVVKDNFATIYELLEEMVDNGQPYITED